jgi:anti-sigma B factor antagonist
MTTLRVSVRRGGPSAGPGESLIVAIGGELDIATVPRFAGRFDEFFPHGLRRIVIDVSKLTFVDVTGLRALTTLRAQAEQRMVTVRLSGVSPQMRRLMKIFGPGRDFPSSDAAAGAAAAEDRPRLA